MTFIPSNVVISVRGVQKECGMLFQIPIYRIKSIESWFDPTLYLCSLTYASTAEVVSCEEEIIAPTSIIL